ncbi:SDR family NAD(P)-dependent oxidoreductase [Planctomycetota bacterium]
MAEKIPTVQQLFDLTGKVALLTGAARGIGYHIATGFVEVGATVIITDMDGAAAKKAAEQLSKDAGGKADSYAMDVTDQEQVNAAFDFVKEKYGKLDILVNNAGHAPRAEYYHLWNRELKDWNTVVQTNLNGAFLCSQAAVKLMMEARSGSIINIASIAALAGRDRRIYEGLDMRPNIVDYGTAKAGVLGFTYDSAAEMAPYNIRVNAISPGGVKRDQPTEFIERYCDLTMARRMAKEETDFKAVAVLLASDASAYITGQNIVVDGGFCVFK